MRLQTATQFDWLSYTKTWVIRAIGTSIICSLLFVMLSAFGAVGLLVASGTALMLVGAVLLWTVAEMIDDGLHTTESVGE